MLQHKPAICLCLAVTLIYAAQAAQLPRYTPPQYYHYPAPRHQLTIPVAVPQQQQQYARYAQQRQYQQQQQRYVQQQQQQYQPANSYYQRQAQQSANVVQQFSAPKLENVAFTAALTNQGYTYGGGNVGHASSISTARALSSALTLPPSIAAEAAQASNDNGAIDSSDSSVNLKLPLPINIAPIKVQPLPLQAGASFSELANAVTSYGTVYPQRKRR